MHIYIYMCTRTYIHMYIFTCTYKYVHVCTCIYIHKYTYIYLSIFIYTYTHIYALLWKQTRKCLHNFLHFLRIEVWFSIVHFYENLQMYPVEVCQNEDIRKL